MTIFLLVMIVLNAMRTGVGISNALKRDNAQEKTIGVLSSIAVDGMFCTWAAYLLWSNP